MVGEEDLLDVRQAAATTGRTPETVRRWIWSGRLPAQKHGNRLLMKRSDLERLWREQRSEPLSLSQWLSERRRIAGATASTGTSAADLVIEDRRQRHGL